MKTSSRLVAIVPLLLFVGCAQVLGLGDYTDQPETDAAVAPEAAAADHTSNVPDAPSMPDVIDAPPDVPCAERKEDCTNGIDDNCDGLADCADPQCAAFACIEAAPTSWDGPVELYEGVAAPPACAAPFSKLAADANKNLLAAANATCGCTCGAAAGVTCSAPTLEGFTNPGCTSSCITASLTANTCVKLDAVGACANGPKGATLTASNAAGGSCAATPTKTVPPLQWEGRARVCSQPTLKAGGCMGGSVCAGKPTLPFLTSLCITSTGDVPCPAGPYTERRLVHRSVTDDRSCSTCSCGPVAGADCGGAGRIKLFSSTNCAGGTELGTALDVASACTATPMGTLGARFVPVAGGTCTPSGGTPTGSATPTEPITICCAP